MRRTGKKKDGGRRDSMMGLRKRLEKEPVLLFVYFLLRFSVIAVLVLQCLNGNYYNVFLCVLTLILLTIPSIIEHRLKIEIPNTLEIIVIVMVFSAEILGEISSYYTKYPGWDTALHTLTGFLTAAVGFSIVELMNRSSRNLSLSPFFVCLFSFCFSMMIGVLWEFFECMMDYFFFLDMQKDSIVNSIHSVTLDPENLGRVVHVWDVENVSVNGAPLPIGGYLDIGLYDTMKDLAVTFIGSVTYSLFGFFYLTGKSKGHFFRKFILTWDDEGEKE